jgi:hypothetical protein
MNKDQISRRTEENHHGNLRLVMLDVRTRGRVTDSTLTTDSRGYFEVCTAAALKTNLTEISRRYNCKVFFFWELPRRKHTTY